MKVSLPIIVVVLLVLAITSTQTSCSGPSAEEITAQAEREAYDKKITFTMPLEYTATASQCNKDGCRTRYYFPRSK